MNRFGRDRRKRGRRAGELAVIGVDGFFSLLRPKKGRLELDDEDLCDERKVD